MKKEESYALKCVHHSHLKTRTGTKSMNRKNHNLVEWTHSAVGRMKKKKSQFTLFNYIREPLDPGSLYFTENKVGQSSFLPQISGFEYKMINYKSFLHP